MTEISLFYYNQTSDPRRHIVEMHASAIIAFGLWPWNPFSAIS